MALETSCDDTCAAVIEGAQIPSSPGRLPRALRRRFRRVASRHHLDLVNAVVTAALEEAETSPMRMRSRSPRGPGLIGALLVGLSTAKALAAAHRKPLIPVDHLHGHVAANFLGPKPLDPPFLCLIASGGHPVGGGQGALWVRDSRETVDDAAGEAFDKGARLLAWVFPAAPRSRVPPRAATRRRSSSPWR